MEDYVSSWSAGPPGSAPHTPIGQAPPPFYTRGLGSSTSLCTTDDEEAESQYPWTAENEQLVINVFQEYQNNPHNTPFSGRFPPSGVVQKVARTVMRRAPRNEFPHSVVAVRRRILLICAREDPGPAPPSPSDTFVAQLHSSIQQPPHSTYQTGAIGANRLGSAADYEQFDFSETRNGAPLSSPFKEEFQPRQNSHPNSNSHPQPAPLQQPPTDPHVLNIVAQRKRDSLKMKRGLK